MSWKKAVRALERTDGVVEAASEAHLADVRAELKGKQVHFALGYSHPVRVKAPGAPMCGPSTSRA